MLKCCTCKVEKQRSDFFPKMHKQRCKACSIESNKRSIAKNPERAKIWRANEKETASVRSLKSKLKLRYNLTIEEYNLMLEAQNNVCAICKMPENCITKTNKNRLLAIDHCHKTGNIRALLCDSCNRGIGYLRESVKILDSAKEYILKHNYTGK